MPKKNFTLDDIKFDGCLPSPPDDRDYTTETVCLMAQEVFPEEYRTEGNIPVINQKNTSSCVAHALAVATAYGQYKTSGTYENLSRGYIYGNRRGTDYQGEGMHTRQALKQLNHCGDCLQTTFPYLGTYPEMKAKIAEKSDEYAEKASSHTIKNYFRMYTESEVKRALMNQGAVVVAVTVYDSFTTHIPLPSSEDKIRGGHAMCCVGWNKEGWILQNSWGTYAGDKGFYYLPYDYPVNEWWGITAGEATPTPEKDGILKRIWNAIRSLLKRIFVKKS